jgi:hypothetical protein
MSADADLTNEATRLARASVRSRAQRKQRVAETIAAVTANDATLDPADRQQKNGRSAFAKHGQKARLLTFADLDKRTGAALRASELIDAVVADLGGIDRLAVAEQQIVQRASLLGVMAEDLEAKWLLGESIDATVLCTLANAQRRLFEAIGLQRRQRDVPSLADYLRETAETSEAEAS